MPELPEVQVVCNLLYDKIINKNISNIVVNCRNLRVPITQDIDSMLINKTINDITRRGKYIVWHMEGDICVIIHLGMSGKLTYVDQRYGYSKHDHIIFVFDDYSTVIFNDARRFGLVIALKKEKVKEFFHKLGIEPLTDEFNGRYLHKLLKNTKTNIKLILMNNNLVVGIGNIYASESLFRASISPLKLGKDLSYQECEKLTVEIKNTLSNAIVAGGSTIKNYSHPLGSQGEFQNSFYVYGRSNKPCKICNNSITLIKQSGRSTYFCKVCQN
ncbi:MAG: bifunctional DNA-formamidopyrimidine glycosylase/DNA-(apurinic or apyrimidinic site) lyase [Wolbachia endosymbiont of Fragariocoptes setiger]|nr:bifunctional DNA-formamidopyrimidine glycosylase/DNA-(apurinic or apyrimidinic site) lyase [Wolbachia endosymbiont of Fragariocoptes setiger]